MSGAAAWLDRHTNRAPAALRTRVHQYAGRTPGPTADPAVLAAAGRQALEDVATHPGDRSVALDLLAADALITLALLAQAQRAPDGLGAFAASMLEAGRPDA